jgi:hypothetical protein
MDVKIDSNPNSDAAEFMNFAIIMQIVGNIFSPIKFSLSLGRYLDNLLKASAFPIDTNRTFFIILFSRSSIQSSCIVKYPIKSPNSFQFANRKLHA